MQTLAQRFIKPLCQTVVRDLAGHLRRGQGELASAVFAGPGPGARAPRDPLGQVGYYGYDITPLVAGTWEAARAAAACALAAADLVAGGGR